MDNEMYMGFPVWTTDHMVMANEKLEKLTGYKYFRAGNWSTDSPKLEQFSTHISSASFNYYPSEFLANLKKTGIKHEFYELDNFDKQYVIVMKIADVLGRGEVLSKTLNII